MTRFIAAALISGIYLRRSSRHMERSVLHLIPVGVGYAMAATFFTYAFFRSSIGITIFGYYIANLLSSIILGIALFREVLDRAAVIAFLASVAAIAAISLGQLDNGSGHSQLIGFVFAIIAGISATVIGHEQKRLSTSFDSQTITFAQLAVGGICAIPVVIFARDSSITNLTLTGYGVIFIYGFMFFATNWLSVYGFRHGPLGLGTILLSVEVAVGPALAWVFFGQTLNTLEIVGGLLTSVAVISTARRRRPAETEDAPTGAI